MKKVEINSKTKKIIGVCVYVALVVALIASSFLSGWYIHQNIYKAETKTYSVEATVTEVITDTSEVFFKTTSGHIFCIVTGEVFAVDEKYTITFNTNGTPTVEDDEIYNISRNIKMY